MLSRITAVIVFLFLFAGSITVNAEPGKSSSRIMVLPFDGTSSGNFSYLTDSIRAMVSSRLAGQTGVEIVDYSINADEILMLKQDGEVSENESFFSKFKTDYVVTGALYELQTGLKIQVTLTGSKLDGMDGKFSALATNEARIIQSVEGLVQDIVAKGLGVDSDDFAVTTGRTDGGQGGSGFSTEHPEKIFKKGVYGGSIVAEGGTSVKAIGVRRSSPIPTMMVAMATGDLDGDGKQEIVAASRTTLEIYQFDEIRFRKHASHNFGAGFKIHAVNIADLNGDGLVEIVISANEGERAASAIYNWRSSVGLVSLISNVRHYLRPVEKPGEGVVLAGQRGSSNPVDGYVQAGISRMVIEPGFSKVSEGEKLGLPRNVRLFDFIWADLDGNGSSELAVVDKREKLLVYDSSNSLIWVSEEDYGGSRNFFGPTRSGVKAQRNLFGKDVEADFDRKIVFVPSRLFAVDVDGDGTEEIIVGKNKRLWSKWMSNTREYDGGVVACLSWQDSVMQELWHTNKINGYIADYSLSSSGSTKKNVQLFVSQIPEKMLLGFLMNEESKLLRYELEIEGTK